MIITRQGVGYIHLIRTRADAIYYCYPCTINVMLTRLSSPSSRALAKFSLVSAWAPLAAAQSKAAMKRVDIQPEVVADLQ